MKINLEICESEKLILVEMLKYYYFRYKASANRHLSTDLQKHKVFSDKAKEIENLKNRLLNL